MAASEMITSFGINLPASGTASHLWRPLLESIFFPYINSVTVPAKKAKPQNKKQQLFSLPSVSDVPGKELCSNNLLKRLYHISYKHTLRKKVSKACNLLNRRKVGKVQTIKL